MDALGRESVPVVRVKPFDAVSVLATVRVPVRFALLDMVCEFINPEVIAPVTIRVPPTVALLDTVNAEVLADPVTASEVVVACDVVLFTAVKFCRVVEPATNRSPNELMVVVAVPPK